MAADELIDELIVALEARPAGPELTRHLAEIMLLECRPVRARRLARLGLRDAPGDVRLLHVLVASGVELPATVETLVDLWSRAPAPLERSRLDW